MKKFLMLLSMLLVLASCSKVDIHDLSPNPVIDRIDSVDIIMKISNEPEVNQINTTRAYVKGDGDFTPVLPTSFKAYFVSADATPYYAKGSIVKIANVVTGDNSITLPDIKYNVYVTNMESDLKSDNTKDQEVNISSIDKSFPESNDFIYLYGYSKDLLFHNNQNTNVTLGNPYAAVCIAHNQFATGAQYNVQSSIGTKVYKDNGKWFYLYIKASNTNSTIWITGIPYNTGSYLLSRDIKPNNVYEYIVSDSKEGNKFTVSVKDFIFNTPEDIYVP